MKRRGEGGVSVRVVTTGENESNFRVTSPLDRIYVYDIFFQKTQPMFVVFVVFW